MPRSKRLHTDDPEWTRRKPAIEMMYVFDRLSQKKIRDKLEEDGFSVTKSELEAQLHFWNIRKNASADVWRYTDHMLLKREQQGKASVVYYNRNKISYNTLKKERSRYQPDALTKYTTAESPKTPEGMELCICTPPAAPMQSMWAHTLPWTRFQDRVFSSILSYLTNRMIHNELPHPGSQAQLDFSPLHRQFNGIPFRSASDLSVNLAAMMPEKADNEIANSAKLIMQGATEQAFNEHIKLILYCLSNNMYEIDYEDKLSWLTVVNLIERSGLTKQPLDLAQEKGSTVASIAENLFKRCIEFRCSYHSQYLEHASNSNVISWLLESGQNPNVEVDLVRDAPFLPLALATTGRDYELAIQLLDAGADPNTCSSLDRLLNVDDCEYLKTTTERRDIFKNLVLRLVEAGASLMEGPPHTWPSALMWAVRLDLEVAEILIQHGAEVEYQTRDVYRQHRNAGWAFIRTHSVMGFAMYNSDEEQAMAKIRHLLDHIQRSHPSIPLADHLADDVVCLAAYFGFKEVVEYCCGSQNTQQHVLFSALCAASFSGFREVCELLLQYGAPVRSPERLEANPTPLHFAALRNHSSVIKLLCQHGADVNNEFIPRGDCNPATNCMWTRAIMELSLDIRTRDLRSCYINPLGAAIIGAGDRIPQSLETLIQHGAKLPLWAVYYGARIPQHPGITSFAVEQGGNLNWRGPDGKTPLQKAVQPFTMAKRQRSWTKFDRNDCLAVINSLVAAGAETAGSEAELTVLLEHWSHPDEVSIRALNNDSRQACKLSRLASFFLTRSISTIERVLAKSLGAYDPGALCTGVMLAISSSSTEHLRQLIINRPEAFHGTEQEGLALGLAAWHSRVDILDMLLSKIQTSTPALVPTYSYALGYCVGIPEKEDLQANISESFEEDIPFWHQEPAEECEFLRGSPLVFSIWSQDCLDKLLENGFRPDRLTLAIAIYQGEVELIEKLVHDKECVDDSDLDRPGPLYVSVEKRLGAITRVLLNAGLSPNESNDLVKFGRSPLQKAVEDGNLEMIDLLLEYRADVNAPAAKDGGATALQLAAIQGRLGIARRLIDLEANVNASGAELHGRTALEGASEHGRLDMVQLLLDCGACVDGDGCSQYFKAIRFAEEGGHMVVANFLRNHREWTSNEEDPEELRSLEEHKDRSVTPAESSSSSCMNGDSSEILILLDHHSDCEYDSSKEDFVVEGRISPNEASPVDRSPGRLRSSSSAVSTDAGFNNIIVERHLPSPTYDDPPWNNQFGNAENGVQTSSDIGPIEAVCDVHSMQDFQTTDASSHVESSQKRASGNEDLLGVWDPLLTECIDYEMRMEEQLFPVMTVDSTWNQQSADWEDPQTWLHTEMDSGFCFEITEEDMDWTGTQNLSSQ